MKNTILIIAILLFSICTYAQSDRFKAAMSANLAAMDTSFKNPASLLKLANTFERIGQAEKNQWLPFYYAAFLQVNLGFMSKEKIKVDMLADKATELINIADSLSPGNSEISTIRSMIASCRLMADPMNRYMEYGPVSMSELDKAIQQDPLNPRPYYLKGENLKYTPEQFGGGCKTATPHLLAAAERFNTFKLKSAIHPNWGKERTLKLVQDCSN